MIGSDEKEWKAQESCFCVASDLQKYHCFCATVRLFGDLGGFGEGIGMVWKSGFSSQPSLGVNLITQKNVKNNGKIKNLDLQEFTLEDPCSLRQQ